MPPKTILDTDILSTLMRRTPAVLSRARHYSVYHPKLTFSLITRYEILRGLKAKKCGNTNNIIQCVRCQQSVTPP